MNKSHVALTRCYFCGEPDKILLATRYVAGEPVKDLSPAHDKVIDMEPCKKCADFMKQGVILLTIDDKKSDKDWNKPDSSPGWIPNPFRTGGFFVVTDEFVRKLMNQQMADWAIKHRFMFIEHEAAEQIGLFAAHAQDKN